MKITSMEIMSLSVPVKRKIKTGFGTIPEIQSIIVKLSTDEDICGIGESAPFPLFSEETSGSMIYVLEYLASVVLGADPTRYRPLMQRVDKSIKKNPFAKAAIEIAVLDICGKYYGVPVYDLLGGAFRKRIPLSWSLSSSNTKTDLKEAHERVEEGFFTFKIKAGSLPIEEEILRLREIRKALASDDIKIRIDANQGWSFTQTKKAISGMTGLNLDFIEQPLASWDTEGAAALRKMTSIPILADESVFTCQDAINVIRQGAADIIGLKVQKHGGIMNALKIATIAQAAGLDCYIGSRIGLQVSGAAALHLGALLPELDYGCEEYCQMIVKELIVDTSFNIKDGYIEVPQGPGLGVKLDEAAVKKYLKYRKTI